MRDTLGIGMGRAVAQFMAVFAAALGLLNAQCLAVCTAQFCKPNPKPAAPVEHTSSHCHPRTSEDKPSAPSESKRCAHETVNQSNWEEVKPLVLSYTPTVELHHLPPQAFSMTSAAREISADAVSPPLPGIVSVTVLRI